MNDMDRALAGDIAAMRRVLKVGAAKKSKHEKVQHFKGKSRVRQKFKTRKKK